MTSTSIRTRLIASIAAIQITGAALVTFLFLSHERSQSYAALDATLREQAAVIRSLIEAPEQPNGPFVFHKEFLSIPSSDLFLITDVRGRTISTSRQPLPPVILPPQPRAVLNLHLAGKPYRALVLQNLPLVDPDAPPSPESQSITLIYATPTAPVEAHLRHIATQAAEACLALLASATFISAWALTFGLRPLRNLASDAEKIDVGHWTLSQLEEGRRFTELRPLADSLARLVDRLRNAFHRERQFFGDAAHEMKSSVAIVRSTVQYALQTDRTAAEYRKELQDALADTARLQDLVAGMLDLARIESNAAPPTPSEYTSAEVHAEVQRVIARLRPLAAARHVRVHTSAEPQETWARISEEDLSTTLTNLLENAILYSDPGKQVTIAIRTCKGHCEIIVQDQGCGIAPTALPYIFDRFYRSDASRTRSTGGVGLGLSIAKALITRANGTLSVESEQGKGSAFRIAIPTVEMSPSS
ncbi:MAG TPA: ATP-binding protein [Acidobacteriaceae bacterium]|nr:ATP-binding protein [Acidobacteriaceae bacterium]